MRNVTFITAILLMLPFLVKAQLDRSKMPEPGPAPQIQIGNFESFTLDNGLKVFVVENSKLPVVSFSFLFDYDRMLESDKAGMSDITGQLLKTGTSKRTKEEIDEAIDFIGARVSTSATSVFASSLSRHTGTLLNIISDVIIDAKFNQEELDRIKTQTISGLATAKNSPEAIIQRLRLKLVYGDNHPYGESPSEETVNNITLEDCENFYKTYMRPNVSYLAIVGDVKKKDIQPLIERYFGAWEKKDVPEHTYETPHVPEKTTVSIVDRPVSVQSTISIALPVELQPATDESMKAGLMNSILGGGTARLFYNLRETHGYTYGAYSSLSPDKLIGNFNASTSVRTSVTDSAITEILYEINRIRDEVVPEDEFNLNKNELSGAFALSLERAQTIARFALNIERYKLPADYYTNYLKKLETITQKDVQEAAQKYLKPEKAHIIVVGKADEIAESLKKFSPDGKINFYDEEANWYDPAMKLLPAPEGLTAEKVIENYIEAKGGRKRLSRIKDITLKYSAFVQGMVISMETYQKAPNKMMIELNTSGMVISRQIFDGQKGLADVPMMGQKEELEGEALEAMKIQATMNIELDYAKHGVTLKLLGIEKIGDNEAYKVEKTLPNGSKSFDYFDVKTGLKVRSLGEGGRADFADYRTVKGLKYPFEINQEMEGQSFKMKLQSVDVNKKLKDSLFEIK